MSDDGQSHQHDDNFDNDDNVPKSPEDNVPLSPTEQLRNEFANQDDDDDEKSEGSVPRSPSPPQSPLAQDEPTEKPGTSDIDSDDVAHPEDHDDSEKNSLAGPSESNKRALIDSDDSDNEGITEAPTKRRVIAIDDSDDEPETANQKDTTRQLFGDDSDDDAPKAGSGDEYNEFEEKNDEEGEDADQDKPQSDDDDVLDDDRKGRDDDESGRFEWDFDIMLREKKAERKGKRRRGKDGGIDIINDDDGVVSMLIERMKSAAKADRNANVERKPAFQKIKLLPEVRAMMLRAGIADALIENGFMSVLSEWLAPLPDKCLPALDIRITLLKLLHNPRYWKLDRSTLKHSGLGKAVMLLYKHPNETKENKMIANKLIGEWARPIFQLDTDYSSMTREERLVRDYERMPEVKKKKMNINKLNNDDDEDRERRRPQIKETDELGPTSSGQLKPGDKGYINRARVPKPSTKDYVVRPKWNIEGECKERKATGTRRYDQAFREFQERTKRSKASRAVTVSLEGRNLQI